MQYQQQQTGPFRLDRSCSLVSSGRVPVAIIHGASNRNLADDLPLVKFGNVASGLTTKGRGHYVSGTPNSASGGGDITASGPTLGAEPYIEFWHGVVWSAVNTYCYLFGSYNGSSGTGVASAHDQSNRKWGFYNGSVLISAGDFIPLGVPVTIVIVRESAATNIIQGYRDGILYLTDSSGAAPPGANFTAGSLGPNQYTFPFGTNCTTLLAGRIRGRGWNAAEVKQFCQNPWQLFKSPQRVLRAAAGADTYSLSATAGNYGLAGQLPALRTARKLSSTVGTYSLAGAVASALRALQIRIDRGGYELSGAPTGIAAARRLAASAGAFALSGSAAVQRSARSLSASLGVYQRTGATASLVYTPAVVLGSYSLAASSGTFTLAVGAVAYRAARRLAAAPGAFVLTGPAAALWRGRRSSIAPGSFATVGSDVAIRAARRIAADVGTFAINGGAAILGYSSSVQYARAPAGPGYAPQRAEYQVRPVGETQRRPTEAQRSDR